MYLVRWGQCHDANWSPCKLFQLSSWISCSTQNICCVWRVSRVGTKYFKVGKHSLHKNVTLKLLEYCFLHTFPDALESSFETLLKLLLGLLKIKWNSWWPHSPHPPDSGHQVDCSDLTTKIHHWHWSVSPLQSGQFCIEELRVRPLVLTSGTASSPAMSQSVWLK